jgi:hypothetical protein
MIATTHALVGAAAAMKARSVAGAVTVGALTHLLLDAIPHRDYRRNALCGLALPADLAAGAMTTWCLSHGSKLALAGALGGVMPDALRVVEQVAGVGMASWAHDTMHTDSRPPRWWSVRIQGLIAMTAAAMLGRSRQY